MTWRLLQLRLLTQRLTTADLHASDVDVKSTENILHLNHPHEHIAQEIFYITFQFRFTQKITRIEISSRIYY
jgi:hypothetical protein